MTFSDIIDILKSIDVHPSRKLGQNFLIDGNILSIITDNIDLESDYKILEIGPGTGVLSEKLAKFPNKLVLIEYDYRLANFLKEKFSSFKNVSVINMDACLVNYQELFENENFVCVSNLPYKISSIVIAKLLDLKNPPSDAIFLLQKEMGDRILGQPFTKLYGSLSVRAQAVYNIKKVKTVSANCFYPRPRVDSIILKFSKKDKIIPFEVRNALKYITKVAFSARRKKLLKLLRKIMTCEDIDSFYNKQKLDKNVRAEEMSISNFIDLTDIFLK